MTRDELLQVAAILIEDQDSAREYHETVRRAALQAALEDGLVRKLAPGSLADWLSQPEALYPITDGVDVWEARRFVQQAWDDFITTGYSGTPFFACRYVQAVEEE